MYIAKKCLQSTSNLTENFHKLLGETYVLVTKRNITGKYY